jgi:hypothetical protein
VIGLAAWQLQCWGWTMRGAGGVCDVLAQVACERLGVADHMGRPLSSDRIEQIFEAWLKTARRKSGWKTVKDLQPYGRPWARVTVDYLRSIRPDKRLTLEEEARRLVDNGGRPWTASTRGAMVGDPEPTGKGWAELAHAPRFARDDETG